MPRSRGYLYNLTLLIFMYAKLSLESPNPNVILVPQSVPGELDHKGLI